MFPICLATITEDNENRDWDEKLLDVQWALNNNSVHKVTKRTPYEIVFSNRAVGLHENPLTKEVHALNKEKGLEEAKTPVVELLEENRAKLKEQFDKKRKEARLYEPGDLVMILSTVPSTGESRKLERTKKGPYEIVKSVGNDRYLVTDI